MLQPYPEPDPAKVSKDAAARIASLKDMINACRTLRGEMDLSQRPGCLCWQRGTSRHSADSTPYLMALAKLSTVEIVDELPDAEAAGRNRRRVQIDAENQNQY